MLPNSMPFIALGAALIIGVTAQPYGRTRERSFKPRGYAEDPASYTQCGGIGYIGPVTCVPTFYCDHINVCK